MANGQPGTPKSEEKSPRISSVDTFGSRQSAAAYLESMIAQLDRRRDDLVALHAALPRVMPPEADEALWRILTEVRLRG